MINRTRKLLKGTRGSAMVMAIVTTVVLAILAIAIMTLSMGNLTVSQADALNNDVYYAAESGVNSALEQLKGEVMDYYNAMINASSTQYPTLYNNFFTAINTNANSHFKKPLFKDLDTTTTFSTGTFDSTNNVCEYLISCTATTVPDNAKYRVDAKLYVKRLNVKKAQWLSIDGVAYKIGGTLNLNAGYGVYNGGSVITGAFNNPKNIWYSVAPPGTFQIKPEIINSINDTLTYPSYITPSVAELEAAIKVVDVSKGYQIYNYTNDTTLGKGSFLNDRPVLLIAEKNLTISGGVDVYPGSIVYKKGSGTLTLSGSNTNHTFTAYSDGNVIVNQGPVYANIYCRGDINTSGNYHGNVMADGNCINTCGTFVGTMIVGGTINASGGLTGSFFGGGAVSVLSGLNGSGNIIYSKTKVTIAGGYNNVAVFSGGDVVVSGGSSLSGAVIAKGGVSQNGYLTLDYSTTAIANVLNQDLHDQFFNNFFLKNNGAADPVTSDSILINQEITAIGRQN